ncbi:30S ribosomal protein S3 [Candidatus Woesebacteria bacterium]|nr:30S ribosomal protein S3 [Candidatus Woesebacteria bacterium]
MGHKVNPIGFRLGNTFTWKSRWHSDPKTYADLALEDYRLRRYLEAKLLNAQVVRVDIERSLTVIKVILLVARPGVVIGKGGSNLEEVKKGVEAIINAPGKHQKSKIKADIRVEEVTSPELSAKLIAETISQQLIKRYPHRRAVSQAQEKVMQAGAKGVKIVLSGRIGGAEIGRTEKYSQGSVPTQTLRANIDYFQTPAKTRSGYVGIKVWVYKGESKTA